MFNVGEPNPAAKKMKSVQFLNPQAVVNKLFLRGFYCGV